MPRPDKHQPQEVSSKQPCPVLRPLPSLSAAPTRRRTIDPRFDRAFGHYNPDLFQKSFTFLDDLQQQERATLARELAECKDSRRQEELKRLLARIKSKDQQRAKEERRKTLVKEWRKTESELVRDGRKRPFYLKERDVKKLEVMDEFKRLRERNPDVDIDKVVEKKRKRKAAKQHRDLPFRAASE